MTDKNEEWEVLDTYTDEASAQALAGHLRDQGVPANVKVRSPLPGLVSDVKIMVPRSLEGRAREILESTKVSDEELTRAATGKPASGD